MPYVYTQCGIEEKKCEQKGAEGGSVGMEVGTVGGEGVGGSCVVYKE